MNSKIDKTYTNTEVGTLIENFDSKLEVIAERVGSLAEDVAVLKDDMREVKTRLITVEDGFKTALPDLFGRVTKLEAKAG